MTVFRTWGLALGLAVMTAGSLQSQVSPFSIEGVGSVAFPTGDFGDAADTGFGLGATVGYRVLPLVGIYVGYSWYRFGFEEAVEEDVDLDVTDSGFQLGARVGIPLPAVPIEPFLRGGLLYNRFEINAESGPFSGTFSSDRSVGFEVGGGVELSALPMLVITPGVRFRSYSADVAEAFGSEGDVDLDVNYLSIDLGLRLRL